MTCCWGELDAEKGERRGTKTAAVELPYATAAVSMKRGTPPPVGIVTRRRPAGKGAARPRIRSRVEGDKRAGRKAEAMAEHGVPLEWQGAGRTGSVNTNPSAG